MDDALLAAFNDQIALEQQSARAYRQLAIWAEARDLSGMAEWFNQQADEETEHADLFIAYVLDRDGEVVLQPLDAPASVFTDAVAAFDSALAHEEKVTAAIGQLYGQVTAAGDYRSIPLLTRFLDEQVHEEAAVRTIVGELRMTGGDPTAVLMLDRELPGRRGQAGEGN
ncbi:MAG: ferritin [Euzebya sp.]